MQSGNNSPLNHSPLSSFLYTQTQHTSDIRPHLSYIVQTRPEYWISGVTTTVIQRKYYEYWHRLYLRSVLRHMKLLSILNYTIQNNNSIFNISWKSTKYSSFYIFSFYFLFPLYVAKGPTSVGPCHLSLVNDNLIGRLSTFTYWSSIMYMDSNTKVCTLDNSIQKYLHRTYI